MKPRPYFGRGFFSRMMKPFLFLFFVSTFMACAPDTHIEFEHTGLAQGSTYQIKYVHTKNMELQTEIDRVFAEIDNSMNAWMPESIISRLNADSNWVVADKHFLAVLDRSREIAEETNGQFDPTLGPLIQLWGFGYDEVRGDISEKNIMEKKALTGMDKVDQDGNRIRLKPGSSIDFNAIAQGYTVDMLAELLEDKGIKRYMVEVGGEIRARGLNIKNLEWAIGVDKPNEQIIAGNRFQFILRLNNAALATSGSYRKFWVDEETGIRYSHTIDPKTGRPALNRLLSASIIASNAMDADAYATVCMVKGVEECIEFLNSKADLEGYLVYSNNDDTWGEYITAGFKIYVVE